MIPRAHITDWRSQAPWPTDAQVEQDLVLTRALTEIFIRSAVANAVAFRGGTALHKLYLEENLTDKMQDDAFLEDVEPLLPTGITYRAETAYNLVSSRLIARLPGDPWKGSVP
jgi:hypothetical protein